MVSHLGEAYPKFLFPQSQRPTPPRQLQLTPPCQAEFVICDQTIEEMFGDMKGNGFDLESTHLHSFIRLSRLTLVVTLLYDWLATTGVKSIKAGLRHLVDRKDRRDLSIFQIGWRIINRRLINGLPIPIPLFPDTIPKVSGS